jgi:spermidine/putrescine transport system permease protein
MLGLFFVVPLAMIFLVSFAQRGMVGGLAPIDDLWEWIVSGAAFRNYARSFDSLYLLIHWRSLWVAALTTILCLLIAYPIAYYIARVAPARRRNLLLALVVVPFWTSFLIRTYAWMFILSNEGALNTVLLQLGLIDQPLDILYSPLAVMIGLVYGELPFMILPLYASLEKLDGALLEASADLGAAPAATFFRVTVPLSMPGIVAGVVLVFIPSVGQFIVSDLLGGSQTMLIGNAIQNQFSEARNRPFGAALAIELMAMVMALLIAYALYARRKGMEAAL